jgi:hypothetical protein
MTNPTTALAFLDGSMTARLAAVRRHRRDRRLPHQDQRHLADRHAAAKTVGGFDRSSAGRRLPAADARSLGPRSARPEPDRPSTCVGPPARVLGPTHRHAHAGGDAAWTSVVDAHCPAVTVAHRLADQPPRHRVGVLSISTAQSPLHRSDQLGAT